MTRDELDAMIRAKEWQERLFPRRLHRVYENMETPTNRWVSLPPTITDICFDLRASISGASDPWGNKWLAEVTDMLQARADHWSPCRDEVDRLVLEIVKDTILTGRSELQSREMEGLVFREAEE